MSALSRLAAGAGSLALLSKLACIPPSQPPAVLPQSDALDSLLASIGAEFGSPAVAAAVVDGRGLIAAGAAGVRRIGLTDSVTIADAFHLGSVAKPLSATLIARLVERGALAWTSTPIDVFPELAEEIHPSLRRVTLAQLLAHTAGFPNYNPGTPEWDALPVLEGTGRDQRAAFARWVLSRPAPHPPGARFTYSNAGAPIAAAMAERVTDSAWEELMRELIFDPLGMSTAGYGWPDDGSLRHPWGHWQEDGRLAPHDPRDDYRLPAWIRPAGDVHMSILDLGHFAMAHLRGLTGLDGVLRAATVREMHRPIVSRTETIDHALGWHVWAERSGARRGRSFHAGGGGTFVAFVEISPATNRGFVVMTNDGREPSRVVSAVRTALEEMFPPDQGSRDGSSRANR